MVANEELKDLYENTSGGKKAFFHGKETKGFQAFKRKLNNISSEEKFTFEPPSVGGSPEPKKKEPKKKEKEKSPKPKKEPKKKEKEKSSKPKKEPKKKEKSKKRGKKKDYEPSFSHTLVWRMVHKVFSRDDVHSTRISNDAVEEFLKCIDSFAEDFSIALAEYLRAYGNRRHITVEDVKRARTTVYFGNFKHYESVSLTDDKSSGRYKNYGVTIKAVKHYIRDLSPKMENKEEPQITGITQDAVPFLSLGFLCFVQGMVYTIDKFNKIYRRKTINAEMVRTLFNSLERSRNRLD
jgi:histone H3/H4